MSNVNNLLLQSSPHIVSSVNSKGLMRNMLFALAPVSIFGIVIYGLYALLNIVVAVTATIIGESLFRMILKRPVRANDFSAGVSGLLLALVIPPTTPLWMTAMGAAFGVIVAKEFFGGLGANVFNPALIGRAFLLMSFPAALTTWKIPGQSWLAPFGGSVSADVITGPTPLAVIQAGEGMIGVGESFAQAGLSSSSSYWSTMQTLFIGFHGGCIGDTSIFLILAACVFLLVTKTIDWRTPVSMIGAGVVAAFVLGLDPLFSVLSGGLIFGAVFMATDYVTGPVTGKGRIVFGICAGIITMMIRKWGNYPEGVSYAILIMNGVTPFLDKLMSRKYGFVKQKKGAS